MKLTSKKGDGGPYRHLDMDVYDRDWWLTLDSDKEYIKESCYYTESTEEEGTVSLDINDIDQLIIDEYIKESKEHE